MHASACIRVLPTRLAVFRAPASSDAAVCRSSLCLHLCAASSSLPTRRTLHDGNLQSPTCTNAATQLSCFLETTTTGMKGDAASDRSQADTRPRTGLQARTHTHTDVGDTQTLLLLLPMCAGGLPWMVVRQSETCATALCSTVLGTQTSHRHQMGTTQNTGTKLQGCTYTKRFRHTMQQLGVRVALYPQTAICVRVCVCVCVVQVHVLWCL